MVLLLIPLGLAVGTIGTIIGAGGGFILVPVLILLYPDKSPQAITGISLAVVFFNALSGSVAYARDKRIDYKSGLIFAAATVPGSIIGAFIIGYIPRMLFDGSFGIILTALSIYLFIKPEKTAGSGGAVLPGPMTAARRMTDSAGNSYVYTFGMLKGIIISVFTGFISSLLGIGGGIIHVPAMVHLLNFPVHIATATSHFVLGIMSFSGSVVHLFDGSIQANLIEIALLAIGVLIGAQAGAALSKRFHGVWIIRGLACGLAAAGLRIFIMAFWK
ncbi:MAG: sulfite exporter TauE/SafE family protein [Brevinematales bacterium]|jgi:uncharacterized membrane protein YfcA